MPARHRAHVQEEALARNAEVVCRGCGHLHGIHDGGRPMEVPAMVDGEMALVPNPEYEGPYFYCTHDECGCRRTSEEVVADRKGESHVPEPLRFELTAILAIDSGSDSPQAEAVRRLFEIGPSALTEEERRLAVRELREELGSGGLMAKDGGTDKSAAQIRTLQRQGQRMLDRLEGRVA